MNVSLTRGNSVLWQAGDQGRLRRLNSLAVIEAIRDQALTIPAVAKQTGLSKTAADSVVGDLVELGWAQVVDPSAPISAGRPANRYRFNATAGLVAGIDVGRHTSRAELADLNGEVLASGEVPTGEDDEPSAVIGSVVGLLDELLADRGEDRTRVWAAGVSMPAVVYRDVITKGPHVWSGFDALRAFQAQFDGTVSIENDSNLAAFAEAWRGAAVDYDSIVYIHSGNRTGSGLVLNGALFRGANGAAGEIGALPQAGWESAPSRLTGIRGADGVLLNREQVFAAAGDGQPAAVAAVDAFCADLAVGIAAIVLTLDPRIVVIGGGNVRAGETFLEPLRRHLNELCTVHPAPPVVPSALAERAPLTGAVGLAAASVLERLRAIAGLGGSMPSASTPAWEWPVAGPTGPGH